MNTVERKCHLESIQRHRNCDHVPLAHQVWRLQVGKYTLLRQQVLEIGSTSQVMSAFLASVVHASSIQHGSQDVADQIFENVKLGKLLFLGIHQDTHVIAM